ncbi:MAG: hypothetical protein D6719_01195 [Candidatus Dadabacteria bacterium]|nr:MAG: hypothetical protein D6719_01195 [Candidatus Dadabacteria bacterium]
MVMLAETKSGSEDALEIIREALNISASGIKSSRDLSEKLVSQVIEALSGGKIPEFESAALLTALYLKKPSRGERTIFEFFSLNPDDPVALAEFLLENEPLQFKDSLIKLLGAGHITADEAYQAGSYLLSGSCGLRAAAAFPIALRMRHENRDELVGLYRAMHETLLRVNIKECPTPLIQLAEPFDGTNHSPFITPYLANKFIEQGFNTIMVSSPSPGPKEAINLNRLLTELGASFSDINSPTPDQSFGYLFKLETLSPRLADWVLLRKRLVKRTFFAAVEKFLSPAKNRILITSVFHVPYGEKLVELAEAIALPAIIVSVGGLEGSLTLAGNKNSRLLAGVRTQVGSYKRFELSVSAAADKPLEPLKLQGRNILQQNRDIIGSLLSEGGSAPLWIEKACAYSLKAYEEGINRVMEVIGK